MSKRLIVVDISSFIFRAYYAIRSLTAPDGTPVNAVRGTLSMLLKLMSKYRPTHILLARDTPGGSFRNEVYDQYKANRGEPPEDLKPQFSLIDELVEKMGLPESKDDRYEADDIIGSVCLQWKEHFDEIYIASGDKDLMQFVGDNIQMLDTMKDKFYDREGVFEKMGVWPEQIVDYLSMVGDASDNIPGMRGIGAKGAAKLLAEHGTLEKCIEVKDTFKGKKLTNAFENHIEDALLSKKLVQIVTDIDLGVEPEATEFKFYPSEELFDYLGKLAFNTASKQLRDLQYQTDTEDGVSPAGKIPEEEKVFFNHHLITDNESLKKLQEMIDGSSVVAIHTEYNHNDKITKELEAISFSFDGENSYSLSRQEGMPWSEGDLKNLLKFAVERETAEVCSEHIKRVYSYCLNHEIDFQAPTFDVGQAHYNLSSRGKHDIASMSDEFLNIELEKWDWLKNPISTFSHDEAKVLVGSRACCVFRVSEIFKKDLESHQLEKIYYELDDLVLPILSHMEVNGIELDGAYLNNYQKDLKKRIEDLESRILSISGVDGVNLGSPKQVGELLFEKLGLPVVKKTKTGYSTDVEVLEELDSKGISEVPGLLIQYRELTKLLSTYVKALPDLINSKTGRLHTSFHQNVAQTGRLSSTNPNLQNIPVRTEAGKLIRKAFVAPKGKLLLGADYSQVELRLLAHFSQDPTMIKAFKDGVDIHSQTASEVMGIPLDEVTSADRSKAKAVNFGLMYGQSSFGLAKALRISRKEAKEFITMYFDRFGKVKGYLDSLKEECERTGYAITLHGRKRFLPDIHSKNRTVKSMAERMAINSPIQGTAADIIKYAMIAIEKEISKRDLESKMLLQVHDELIFEVPEGEVEVMSEIVRDKMEGAADLSIPLHVDMGTAKNWFDLK